MNFYIDAQVKNMIAMTKTFKQSCQLASQQDDGSTSKEEAKTMAKINAIADKFIKELEKL